jgi:hypothetical protein
MVSVGLPPIALEYRDRQRVKITIRPKDDSSAAISACSVFLKGPKTRKGPYNK